MMVHGSPVVAEQRWIDRQACSCCTVDVDLCPGGDLFTQVLQEAVQDAIDIPPETCIPWRETGAR